MLEARYTYLFSLVIATLNRFEELDTLFESLTKQTLDMDKFEVIVVDQNDDDLIIPLIGKYSSELTIQHIKITRKSSTFSRNVGIKTAKGEYIAFPDDDCLYYEDTLETAMRELVQCSYPDMIIGKLFDRKAHSYIFKQTPSEVQIVNYYNFYTVVSAVTLFMKNSTILFDEKFGIGEKYYAHEDGELILSHLTKNKRVVYSPHIDIYHPPYNNVNMPDDKSFRYGYGVGAVCKKYKSFPLVYLLIKILSYQVIMMLKSVICLNKKEFNRRFHSFKGGVMGFVQYREK